MTMTNTNRFLCLSIVLLALNQCISNGLCAPEPTTTLRTPLETDFDRIPVDSIPIANEESGVRLDRQNERLAALNSSEVPTNVSAELNASRHDLALEDKLSSDPKNAPKSDLNNDSVDSNDEDDEIEEVIGRDVRPPSDRSYPGFSASTADSTANSSIHSENSTESAEDEHSEIDSTVTSLFDSLNVTLPPLSRMIDLAEQGELDILNKTLPRRILIDMDTNEDIIGPNDIHKLLIDNELDNNDFIETDILSAPGG